MSLEIELATYEKMRNELASHEGQFAVIFGDTLIGVFDTQADALNAGYKECGLDEFLVKKISAIEAIGFFTRSINPPCILAA